MKCPKCGKENDEGISICQYCDFILDPSFLGQDYAQEEEPGSADLDELGADEFSELTPSSEEEPFEGNDSEDEEDVDEEDKEIERQLQELRDKRAKHSVAHSAADMRKDRGIDKGTDKDIKSDSIQDDLRQTFQVITGFFGRLEKADKIAMVCAIGMFLFTIFPWVTISTQGSLSGLEVGGWFLLLLSASLGSLIYLRQDSHWQKREKYVIITQAAVVGIALVFLLVRVISIGSLKPVSPDGLPVSEGLYSIQVGFGFLFSLASTIGAAVATWMLLKQKVLKK